MRQTTKRRGAKAIALGALLASVVSLGVVADTASAAKPGPDPQVTSVLVVGGEVGTTSMRSGIRW